MMPLILIVGDTACHLSGWGLLRMHVKAKSKLYSTGQFEQLVFFFPLFLLILLEILNADRMKEKQYMQYVCGTD